MPLTDGTRQPESFRTLQHEWYSRELACRGIPHEVLTGQVAERLAQVTRRLPIGAPGAPAA